LKKNPMVALQEFEAPANQEYELGRGDEISVEVVGRPEISGKHVVGPDGAITLPFVGSVQLAGNTRKQSAQAIEEALAKYYSNPAVSVGVDRYVSNRVVLLGAVQHPGAMAFDEPPTLLEVLSRGGVQGTPDSPVVLPEQCEIYRGSQTVMLVELRQLLEDKSPLANLRLRKDDIVVVPSAKDRFVSMLGEVSHPGTLQLHHSSTLPQLLAEAGGITPKAGRYPDLHIIHRSTGPSQVISYKAILTPEKLDLTLQSGDIIFVPESGFNRAAYTIEKLSPALTLFTIGALFAH
jgi:polysaccharide export outer membrane protein